MFMPCSGREINLTVQYQFIYQVVIVLQALRVDLPSSIYTVWHFISASQISRDILVHHYYIYMGTWNKPGPCNGESVGVEAHLVHKLYIILMSR
jgi:hypothetical protein